MNAKAQAGIEALIAITAFLSIAIAAVHLMAFEKSSFEEFSLLAKAKNVSLECAMVVNAIASNTARTVNEMNAGCASDGKNMVKSTAENGKTKSSKTIAIALTTNRTGGKNRLEVKTLEHYE